jgi:hypothetical protein
MNLYFARKYQESRYLKILFKVPGCAGNGSLPVQIPVLNVASENVIDEKRNKKSPSERKVRPAVGPMLGTPNKSNGGHTPVCEEKQHRVQQTEKEKQKVVKDVGTCGEPETNAGKEAATPEHSSHSTPAEKTVSATFGAPHSNGKDDNGGAEGDTAMAKVQSGPSEDNNALQDDAPSAKRVCI